MKKTILIATCTLSLLAGSKSQAQVHVNVQFGTPVVAQSWCGSDQDYYYIPEHGVYYNVHRRMYVYPHGGSWCYAPTLPAFYGAYNFAPGSYYRVHARAPFHNHGYYQRTYAYHPPAPVYAPAPRYYGRHDNGWHNGHGGNGWKKGHQDNGWNNGHQDNGWHNGNGNGHGNRGDYAENENRNNQGHGRQWR